MRSSSLGAILSNVSGRGRNREHWITSDMRFLRAGYTRISEGASLPRARRLRCDSDGNAHCAKGPDRTVDDVLDGGLTSIVALFNMLKSLNISIPAPLALTFEAMTQHRDKHFPRTALMFIPPAMRKARAIPRAGIRTSTRRCSPPCVRCCIGTGSLLTLPVSVSRWSLSEPDCVSKTAGRGGQRRVSPGRRSGSISGGMLHNAANSRGNRRFTKTPRV